MKYKNRKGRSESKYHKKENGIIYEIYLFHLTDDFVYVFYYHFGSYALQTGIIFSITVLFSG